MTSLLLDVVYLLILILGLPYVVYKTLTSARFRAGWGERFGGVADLPKRRRIWIHCASVGEALLVRTFVARLKSQHPDADIVFSTNTNTGKETAQKSFPGHMVFYFPLDLSFVVRKVMRRIKPSLVVLVELELWPNFLSIGRRRGLPVVVVNGRITERTARRYRWFGLLSRRMLAKVSHFAVQNEEYAGRFESFGVPRDRLSVVGTMKYDAVATEVAPEVVDQYRRKFRLRPGDEVLLGGCTHPGEDELLIDYLKTRQSSQAGLRLILAPRHRERAGAVEGSIRAAGFLPVRKTAIDAGTAPEGFETTPHVVLLDTTGELARVYAVASVVFVGGSLVPHGGQNMVEPAALAKATVFGPNTWNFRDTVDLLLGRGAAVRVEDATSLGTALDRLFADPGRRAELGARARRLVQENQGATGRNLDAIRTILERTT